MGSRDQTRNVYVIVIDLNYTEGYSGRRQSSFSPLFVHENPAHTARFGQVGVRPYIRNVHVSKRNIM